MIEINNNSNWKINKRRNKRYEWKRTFKQSQILKLSVEEIYQKFKDYNIKIKMMKKWNIL